MNTIPYLERIHYSLHTRPDVTTLRGLQLAHLLNIPFENLDIGLKRVIHIDESAIWNKLIINKRGGFCYELNGLFAWLLKQIGFEVTYLNARDYHEADDTFGIDFDHLVLVVRAPKQSTRWLVDVGWGDTFTQPLDIDNSDWQEQGSRAYKLEPFRDGYQLWQRESEDKIERQYYFDLTPHQFPAEYEAACHYHQTSHESIFTRNRIISRLTETGRISLDNNRLIVTTNGQREEFFIQNEIEFRALLKKHFDITLREENL
ncbi:MAG: arylamine N-acetyltransferase [Chloroflexota bacterium]